jgi:hypothetical protein
LAAQIGVRLNLTFNPLSSAHLKMERLKPGAVALTVSVNFSTIGE